MYLSLCIIIILLIISDRSYDSLIFPLIRHTVVIAQILSIEMEEDNEELEMTDDFCRKHRQSIYY